jgi:hypothetical protein
VRAKSFSLTAGNTHLTFISFDRLLIKASGQGDYWGEYENVRCKVYFKGLPYTKANDDRTYLSVETVKMDFSVKDITMGVENDNNNRVIRKQPAAAYYVWKLK